VILIFEIKGLKKNLLSSSKKQTIFGQIFKHPASWLGIPQILAAERAAFVFLKAFEKF